MTGEELLGVLRVISASIRAHREATGMTQNDLAVELEHNGINYSHRYISILEKPGLLAGMVEGIASTLKLSPDDFLEMPKPGSTKLTTYLRTKKRLSEVIQQEEPNDFQDGPGYDTWTRFPVDRADMIKATNTVLAYTDEVEVLDIMTMLFHPLRREQL